MRRASREAWCEAPRPRFYSCPGVQHRSDSAARSTPTRAQRGTRPKKQNVIYPLIFQTVIKVDPCP
ncbi:MAG: hypothetical protein NZ455_09125 [Bacteroidia bacterium]|nr:hypothetical protein [Bacteroidia bacterium]MDW8346881.1 hypothetical protein [Bacteroidia bacterium]